MKKLTITLILVVLTATVTLAQYGIDTKIESECQGQPLSYFISRAEAECDIRFFYKENWINSIAIPQPTRGKSIKWTIDHAIAGYGLTYIVVQGENVIFIPEGFAVDQKKLEKGMLGYIRVIGNLMEKGKYKLNKVEGLVVDGKTMEPIVGAVVQDKKSQTATTTNIDGHYEIMLPVGQTELEFSFIGLETETVKVDVLSPGKLDVELMESSIELEGVTVTSSGGKSRVNRTQLGIESLDMRTINKLPVLMGEADIVKSMTLLPGVQTSGEMSSGINVRGGNIDQNLILLNEAPIYNTSHLFGLFSTFIPNAVSDVDLYKSTQPANYGGRISAVMEVGLKDADTAKFRGHAGIGVLNSQLFVETPINKNCSFYAGGRTTYSNWILHKMRNVNIRHSKANFYDLIAKVDFRLGRKHKFDVFGYYSNDFFNYNRMSEFEYTQRIIGLNYRWLISPQAQFKVSGSNTDYKANTSDLSQETLSSTVETGINHTRTKGELIYEATNHKMNFGIEANYLKINPGKMSAYDTTSMVVPKENPEEKGLELACFVADNISITDNLSAIVGLRGVWFSKMGSCTEYQYSPYLPRSTTSIEDSTTYGRGEFVKPYKGLEPRIGLRFKLNSTSSIKAGYSYTHQYQELISNSTSAMPSDYWKMADNNIKPLSSHQVSAGYFSTLLDEILDFSAEVYYKTIKNQLDYKNGITTTMNPNIEQDVIAGKVRSYGIELMLKKNFGKLSGWISYTLSKTEIKSNDSRIAEELINNGEYYAASTHHLHDLSVTANYQVTRRWNAAANFVLTSGRPVTFPEYKFPLGGMDFVYYSKRNQYRLPAYHRLDLSVTYEGNLNQKRKVHPSLTFAVYNAYGHKNIYSVFYKKGVPSAATGYHSYGLYKLSIIGVPIPSITLNLKFW